MKKLLSLALSLSLVSSSATLAISCDTGPSKKVEIWLLQESASASSKIASAYESMIKDYNKQRDSKLPEIKYTWKASGAIQKQMLNSKTKMPDLYISYPDSVSYFKEASTTKNLVRDFKHTLGEDYKTSIEDAVLEKSYIDEGTINGQVNVLPYFKSLDFSTINLPLFIEVCGILLDSDETNISDVLTTKVNEFNAKRAEKVFSKDEKTNTNISDIKVFGTVQEGKFVTTSEQKKAMQEAYGGKDKLEELKKTLETSDSIDKTIKDLLTKHSSILPFVKAINKGINFGGGKELQPAKTIDGKYVALPKKNNQNYAMGIDSITNKYFTDHAAITGNNTIQTNGKGSEFLYTVDADVNAKNAIVTLNSKAKGIAQTNKFLDDLKEIAKSNKTKEEMSKITDQLQQWDGTFMSGRMDSSSKVYVSQYFNAGTMLYSSGSTAGMWAYQSSTVLSRWDMLVSSSLNEEGKQGLFLSQGPGIAGFKSQGSNATEKEETVKDFLKYIYKANVQAENSIRSGYLPSTKDGISILEKYHSEKFDNDSGTWQNDSGKTISLEEASYKDEVKRLEETYDFKFKSIKQTSANDILVGKWLTVDMLTDYFGIDGKTGAFASKNQTNDAENKTFQLVIGTPNILGSNIRNALDSTIKKGSGTLMNIKDTYDKKFDAMFEESGNNSLSKWIKEARNDVISDTNIVIIK